MQKTKINARKSQSVNYLKPRQKQIKFTIRRIANKNPLSARSFYQFKRKFSRVATGLFTFVILGLFVIGIFANMHDGNLLKGKIIADDGESFVCTANEIATKFEDLTSELTDLNHDFSGFLTSLSFCESENCAAEKKIYQTEKQIWQLKYEFAELKKTAQKVHEDFKKELAVAEDEVFFCENEKYCKIAEATLQTVRICEKEFQKNVQLFQINDVVEKKYVSANSVENLMESIFKNRIRVAENEDMYANCIAAEDASVCQEYVQKRKEAERKIIASTQELSDLKSDLKNTLVKIDTDIVSLEIGKKDSQNVAPEEGEGWCENEVKDKKINLSKKLNEANGLKQVYEFALKNLKQKRVELATRANAEIEAAEMHAAAEKITEEKREKAEIIFGIWNVMHNVF